MIFRQMKKIIKIVKPLAELSFPLVLSYIIVLFADERDIYAKEIINSIIGLLFIVLILEWSRRYLKGSERPKYESYIFLPVIFIFFLLGLYILTLLEV